jgi:hypothetical protein
VAESVGATFAEPGPARLQTREIEGDMKTLTLMLLAVLWAAPVAAQPDTVVGEEARHGFYLAPIAKLTEIDGEFAVFAGGHLGWIINNQFVLGLGGYGLVHPESRRDIGYGGVLLGAMASPDAAVHIGARVLIGAGHAELRSPCRRSYSCSHDLDHDWEDWSEEWDRWHADRDGETFFVAEPEFLVRVNFAKAVRLSVAGGYRFVDGSSLNSALRGYTGSFEIAIGKF